MTLLDADEKERQGVVGEDTWDLLATIEDSFGITFPDYAAVLGKSVRELAKYIAGESKYSKAERCLSAVMFYRLRRAYSELFDTPRGTIRPATSLDILLPWSSRGDRWRRLQQHLGLTFPNLTCPLWLVVGVLSLSLTIAVASSVELSKAMNAMFGLGLGAGGAVLDSFCFWIAVSALLMKWSTPLARTLPRGCETFGGLVKAVLARNFATLAAQHGGTSEDEIASLLCQLIAAEVGVDSNEITPDTRVPGDLDIE
jgi:hypothetical protein